MTVKELKEKLAQYPDIMDVYIAERKSEFTYGLVNSCKTIEIVTEDDEGEEVSEELIVVIDEE